MATLIRPNGRASKPIKILSVTRAGATWELVLECQWKEKVVLDDRYMGVSHEKLP